MPFTNWDDLISDIKDSAVERVTSGVKSVTLSDGKTIQYTSIDELIKSIELVKKMETMESAGDRSTRVSYGRYRRFR